jgi:hypothetical protein
VPEILVARQGNLHHSYEILITEKRQIVIAETILGFSKHWILILGGFLFYTKVLSFFIRILQTLHNLTFAINIFLSFHP